MSRGVTYYCIPNKRKQFVCVYEPYLWGRGVLRVAERRAVRLGWYRTTATEDAMVAASPRCIACCFDSAEQMLEHALDASASRYDGLRQWLDIEAPDVERVLAEVAAAAAKRDRVNS